MYNDPFSHHHHDNFNQNFNSVRRTAIGGIFLMVVGGLLTTAMIIGGILYGIKMIKEPTPPLPAASSNP